MKRLCVVALICVFAACPSTHSNDAGAGGGFFGVDGGGAGGGIATDGGGGGDAGALPACDCAVDNGVLTMSWACFCSTRDCSSIEPQALCGNYHPTVACGLRTDPFQNIGGTNLRVFKDGMLVGAQLRDDTPSFACPDDTSMRASVVRAGVFPNAGCHSTECDCVDGGVSCDAALPPCDCAVDHGVLTMSWDCYCATYGCDQQPPAECAGYRHSSVACGMRVDTIQTAGGPSISVYDQSGALIGTQSGSDTMQYVCPDDASLRSVTRRAGTFPDAGCTVVACDCVDGGVACP